MHWSPKLTIDVNVSMNGYLTASSLRETRDQSDRLYPTTRSMTAGTHPSEPELEKQKVQIVGRELEEQQQHEHVQD